METPPVIAVDVGGTKIAAGIVSGAAVSDIARLATPTRPKIADLVDAVVQAVSRLPETSGPIAVASAGVVCKGRLLRGHQGLAGSIGLTWLDPGDPASPSLESQVSGAGLSHRVSEILQSTTSSQEILESDDPEVRSIVSEMVLLVAGSIANLAAIIDPEIVVIGGGVGLAPGVIGRIRQAMERYPPLYRPTITRAALGHNPGLVGVADWLRLQSDNADAVPPAR